MLATEHLHPRVLVSKQRAEVILALIRIVRLDPVDEDERVVAFGTADANLRQTADPAGAVDRNAGHVAQRVGQDAGLASLQLLVVDHCHRRTCQVDGHGIARAGGGDDHVLLITRRCRISLSERCGGCNERQEAR